MKLLNFLLIPLLLVAFQNLYCMELNENQTKLKETLDKQLNDQNYLDLTNFLYDQLDNYGNMIVQQWLENKADSTASVHLLYFQIRQLNKIAKSTDIVFTTKRFENALKLILISLIRIQQDIDYCLSLDLKDQTKATAKYTYQIFLKKYWHLWDEIIKLGLEGKISLPDFNKTLDQAKTFLLKNQQLQLPSAAWVTCCSFRFGGNTWGINFGSPSEIEKQAFNNKNSSITIRYDSAAKTITDFGKFSTWAEFFLEQDPTLKKYIK